MVHYPLDVGQFDIFSPLRYFRNFLSDMADIGHGLSILTVRTIMMPPWPKLNCLHDTICSIIGQWNCDTIEAVQKRHTISGIAH